MRFLLSAFADEAADTLDGQLAALSRNGIRQIELRGVDGGSVANLSPAAAREMRRRLDSAGVALSALGSPIGKISLRAPFAPHLDGFRRLLEAARILGAPRLRLFSFYLDGIPPADARAEVFERMDALLSAAAGSGVLCCHENEKGIYGDNIARCLELLTAFSGRLGGVFDPANFLQVGEDAGTAFAALRPYTTYYHIKDFDRAAGELVPAGEGDGRIVPLLRALAAGEGETVLTLEPHLAAFSGLAGLEEDGGAALRRRHAFTDNGAAFDAAAMALKDCLAAAGCIGRDGVWHTTEKETMA